MYRLRITINSAKDTQLSVGIVAYVVASLIELAHCGTPKYYGIPRTKVLSNSNIDQKLNFWLTNA